MIWDFRGPNALPIAEHHLTHLKEFILHETWEDIQTGTEPVSEMHHIAYMIVPQNDVAELRGRLKPHRGQVYTENE